MTNRLRRWCSLTPAPDHANDHDPAEPALLREEIASLRRQLAGARLRAANFEAAIHAALHAAEDGETDPLEYPRYELPESAECGETGLRRRYPHWNRIGTASEPHRNRLGTASGLPVEWGA
jgi:hypothetical protein